MLWNRAQCFNSACCQWILSYRLVARLVFGKVTQTDIYGAWKQFSLCSSAWVRSKVFSKLWRHKGRPRSVVVCRFVLFLFQAYAALDLSPVYKDGVLPVEYHLGLCTECSPQTYSLTSRLVLCRFSWRHWMMIRSDSIWLSCLPEVHHWWRKHLVGRRLLAWRHETSFC